MPEPSAYDRYYEPFLGGGALFFELASAGLLAGVDVCLSDQDAELVELWQAVQYVPDALIRGVQILFAKARRAADPAKFYLEQRAAWNAGRRTTPRQLFLRRTAWNGLWRTNRKGELNTPYRGELPRFDPEPIRSAHSVLANMSTLTLEASDYDNDVVRVPARSIVYVDPPYLTKQRSGRGFTAYTPSAGVWSAHELEALIIRCAAWSADGAHVYFSHADTPLVRDLLSTRWPGAMHQTVMVARAINADKTRRGAVPELLVYEPRTQARLV